jgi:hypothetical protein
MPNKLSEAERLLNTIVSAQVRLSGLRGDQNTTPEPTRDITVNQTQDEAPDHNTEAPSPRPETAESNPVKEEALPESETSAFFSNLSAAIEDIDDEPEEHNHLILGIDPEESDEATYEEEPSPVEPCEPPPETDPFSFIDLIPPEAAVEEPSEKMEPQPSSTPPPIRAKPMMPLPIGRAAGAPRSTKASTNTPTAPEAQLEPTTSRQHISDDDPTAPPTIVELPVAQLAAPREVEPRILDPDRVMLEVDVFEDEVLDSRESAAPADVPKLTETTKIMTHTTQRTSPARTEDQLFDTITEAISALNQGNLRRAHGLFSDVLDWIPDHIEARLARGRCNRDMGDTAGAMSDFLRAQKKAPHASAPHIDIGDLFFARKDYSRAIAHYSDALSIEPTLALTLCRRGICHHYKRQPDRAIDDLRAAQRIDPEMPNIERYIHMVQPNTRR